MRSRAETRDRDGNLKIEVVADLWEARRFASSVPGASRLEVFRPKGRKPYAVLNRPGGRGRWLRQGRGNDGEE
jgi:hypothetical protein